MTDKEAIECMQYLYESQNNMLFKALVDKEYREIIAEGVRIATSALQEREERSKGCTLCYTDAKYNPFVGGYNYCPMCGRKLKGENE